MESEFKDAQENPTTKQTKSQLISDDEYPDGEIPFFEGNNWKLALMSDLEPVKFL